MAADGSVIIEIKGDYDEFLADLEKALKKAKERSKKSDDPLERQRKNTQLTVKELQNLDSVASKALNGIIKGFAAVATASAGALVAISKIGAEFESSFAQVETIMDTSQMSVEDMKSSIQNLSSEMGVSASELSGAVYNAISATGDTANAVSLVGDATRLATAGFTDAESALSVLTTTINAYGMSASDAESISDSLIQTQNLGVTTIDQLASAMGKAISTASAYNVNLGNLESAYVSLTKAGISTEESTTYISSMLNELGDTGSEVGKILKKETGKSFGTLMKEGKSLGDVIEVLSDHVDGSAEALMNLWGAPKLAKLQTLLCPRALTPLMTTWRSYRIAQVPQRKRTAQWLIRWSTRHRWSRLRPKILPSLSTSKSNRRCLTLRTQRWSLSETLILPRLSMRLKLLSLFLPLRQFQLEYLRLRYLSAIFPNLLQGLKQALKQ